MQTAWAAVASVCESESLSPPSNFRGRVRGKTRTADVLELGLTVTATMGEGGRGNELSIYGSPSEQRQGTSGKERGG